MQYSVVNKNQIEQSVFGDRIDAEFYLPTYLNAESTIEKHGFNLLNNITSKIDVGHVGSMVNEYTNAGIWLLQTQNVKAFFLDEANKIFITQQFHEYLKKSKVRKGDILIARSGSFGTASIYLENDEINSADVIIIKPQEQLINPYYLVTYLNSSYGMNQLLRFASGGLQGHVNLTILENLKVCNIESALQNQIEQIVKESYIQRKNSEHLTDYAKTLLLFELDLSSWQPKHQLSFVKNYSDTVEVERIDAEYFQPKYDEIVKAIKGYSGGWDTLGNLVQLKEKNFNPLDKNEYKYIELSNIGGNGEITDCMIEEGQDLPSRARRKVATGDVIVSSIEGSLSSIALIEKEYNQALCSTGFHVINSKSFNSETLLVLLKSMVGQLQFKKGCSGTILTAINQEEFKQIVLPIIRDKTQKAIQQKITESFNLRKQSKHLLECAKRAVEIAIEQNEDAAIKWLKEQTNESLLDRLERGHQQAVQKKGRMIG
ncbi:MAG: restriction endonuclease subunit S [Nitrospirota bacterium]